MKMKRILLSSVALVALMALSVAAKPGFGHLFYDGGVVRTVVPPAANPHAGVDNLYVVMGGTAEQIPVAAVAPGASGYHGGQWAFHSVTWNTSPYTLRSEAEVLAARGAGDVSIERVPANDFKCPIQP